MKEIEFSRWLFELPAKQHSQFSPSGSIFLPCLGLPSKSHCDNSISSIFWESPHQVDMKNVAKCWKEFFAISPLQKNTVFYLGNDETFDRTAMIDWARFNLAKQAFKTCEIDGEDGLTWNEVDACEVMS